MKRICLMAAPTALLSLLLLSLSGNVARAEFPPHWSETSSMHTITPATLAPAYSPAAPLTTAPLSVAPAYTGAPMASTCYSPTAAASPVVVASPVVAAPVAAVPYTAYYANSFPSATTRLYPVQVGYRPFLPWRSTYYAPTAVVAPAVYAAPVTTYYAAPVTTYYAPYWGY